MAFYGKRPPNPNTIPVHKEKGFTITYTPTERVKFNFQRNGNISNAHVQQGLMVLLEHFKKEVLKDYVKDTGDSKMTGNKLDEWLEKQLK